MLSTDVEKLFEDAGAVLHGHFLLASGKHSPVYWEKFRVLQHPQHVVKLCGMIAEHFNSHDIQVVAGPTMGGMILAFEVARQLGARSAYAEKIDTERAFRRGSAIAPDERVLIVDDILTTGSSIHQVVEAVRQKEGYVVAIAVLVDRSDEKPDLDLPLFSCLRSTAISYDPDSCPLCRTGLPLSKPGGL